MRPADPALLGLLALMSACNTPPNAAEGAEPDGATDAATTANLDATLDSSDARAPADASGVCNALVPGPVVKETSSNEYDVNVEPGSPSYGGAILSGTYDLTAAVGTYDPNLPTCVGGSGAQGMAGDTLAFDASSPSAGTFEEARLTPADDGGFYYLRLSGTYQADIDGASPNAGRMLMNVICPGADTTGFLYTATGTELLTQWYGGTLVLSPPSQECVAFYDYTRRP